MNTENPQISVIVPVYKVEKYLKECVDSILAQTYTNIEVILVDDGSPDSCPQICDDYAKQDARVVVIHQENGGVSAARNAGLDIFVGDYLMFVDADDYIEQDMVEFLYQNLVRYGADIVGGMFYDVYSNQIEQTFHYDEPKIYVNQTDALKAYFLTQTGSYLWGKLYKYNLFEGIRFPIHLHIAEDQWVGALLMSNAQKTVFFPEAKYYYRYRNDSAIHGKFSPKMMDMITVSKMFVEFVEEKHLELINEVNHLLTSAYIYVINLIIQTSDQRKQNKNLLYKLESDLLQNFQEKYCNPYLNKKQKLQLQVLRINKGLYNGLYFLYYWCVSRHQNKSQS